MEKSNRKIVGNCFLDASSLAKGEFSPPFDDTGTITDIMFAVLHEYDMAIEGHISVTQEHLDIVEDFFRRWRNHLEVEGEFNLYKYF